MQAESTTLHQSDEGLTRRASMQRNPRPLRTCALHSRRVVRLVLVARYVQTQIEALLAHRRQHVDDAEQVLVRDEPAEREEVTLARMPRRSRARHVHRFEHRGDHVRCLLERGAIVW